MTVLEELLARFRFVVRKKVATIEFPYVIKHAPQNARVSLRNDFSQCIGCHKCEEVCPVHCIDILSEDFPSRDKAPRTSHGVIFEKRVTSFKIDFNKCVSCGICVDICPTGSLIQDKTIILPRQDSRHLVIDLVHRPRTLRREQGYED
jgi:formate hydrogenlyase subunit 6/NADH:ubiquinone oxidoreductase subunit I